MKRNFRKISGLVLLAACSHALADADDTPWTIDMDVAGIHDSNVSRAERERDIVNDSSVVANVGLAWSHQLGYKSAMTLRGFVEAERFGEIHPLNRDTAGLQAIYRFQTRLGYTAPVYQLSISGQSDDYGVHQRNSDVVNVQAFATKRITDRITLTYGMDAQQRESNGQVFDTRQIRGFANADYAWNQDLSTYAAYSYIDGDTLSSAQFSFCNGTGASDIFGLIKASDAVEFDEALNDTFCGNWLAYRLKAKTQTGTLGINRAINHSLSLDASVQHIDVLAEGDNHYKRMLVRAGILARF